MVNVKKESNTILNIYMEIVGWATGAALLFPLIFLSANLFTIIKISAHLLIWLLFVFFVVLVLTFLLYMYSSGKIFPNKMSPRKIRLVLYLWGFIMLTAVACLVYCTGGIRSSIFNWLFAYSVMVTAVVRPKGELTRLNQWRPVLILGGYEILIITVLVCVGEYPIRIIDTIAESMSIWGGGAAVFSLVASGFLFWISAERLEQRG